MSKFRRYFKKFFLLTMVTYYLFPTGQAVAALTHVGARAEFIRCEPIKISGQYFMVGVDSMGGLQYQLHQTADEKIALIL